MMSYSPFSIKETELRPGQQLLPGYVVKLLKTLKITFGRDQKPNSVDVDPTLGLLRHIIDCLGALRDINKVYRAKGSLPSKGVGARAMFGFTSELGNILMDTITFDPPIEFKEAAAHYINISSAILAVFPEICAQATKGTGKMLIHHTALKAAPALSFEMLKMVIKAHPAAAMCQDCAGALPLHWITHNPNCNFEMVSLLIGAYPQGTAVADSEGYLPLHWAVNQDHPNIDVIAALLASDAQAASQPCARGSLPLHWCVSRGNPALSVVEALIKAYPDGMRTFCDDGMLPIHRCVDRSPVSETVLGLLIDSYGQGLQCPNAEGQLPLHRLLDHLSPSARALEMMLVAYPAATQAADDEGYLPLHVSLDCAAPTPAIVRALIAAYPEAARRKTRDGFLPLHLAISCDQPPLDIIQILVDLFPQSVECVVTEVVPAQIDADPELWKGAWVKERWSPVSRARERKLDALVGIMRAALTKCHADRAAAPRDRKTKGSSQAGSKDGMGRPLKDVGPIKATTTRQLLPQAQPPIHSRNTQASIAANVPVDPHVLESRDAGNDVEDFVHHPDGGDDKNEGMETKQRSGEEFASRRSRVADREKMGLKGNDKGLDARAAGARDLRGRPEGEERRSVSRERARRNDDGGAKAGDGSVETARGSDRARKAEHRDRRHKRGESDERRGTSPSELMKEKEERNDGICAMSSRIDGDMRTVHDMDGGAGDDTAITPPPQQQQQQQQQQPSSILIQSIKMSQIKAAPLVLSQTIAISSSVSTSPARPFTRRGPDDRVVDDVAVEMNTEQGDEFDVAKIDQHEFG